VCGPQEDHCKKRCESKVAAKKWLDGRLWQKLLIMTIQVNLCCLLCIPLGFGTKFIWIVVIKIFVISLQPFLGRYLGFHIFFAMAFLQATHFFIAGLFWIRFHFFLFTHLHMLSNPIRHRFSLLDLLLYLHGLYCSFFQIKGVYWNSIVFLSSDLFSASCHQQFITTYLVLFFVRYLFLLVNLNCVIVTHCWVFSCIFMICSSISFK